MTMMRRAAAAGLFGVVLAAFGCGGGPKYVKVSGVVTVDGQPYGKAVVTFQPRGTKDNPDPGRGSNGETNEQGRYSLKTDEGVEGAVVGTHVVRIMTRGNDVVGFDPTTGSPDGDLKNPAKGRGVDPIGPEWNATSDKTFVVPPEGTDKADFAITSWQKKGKR